MIYQKIRNPYHRLVQKLPMLHQLTSILPMTFLRNVKKSFFLQLRVASIYVCKIDISLCNESILLTRFESIDVSQPFRAEITKIVVNYLAPGGVRELNLTKEDRLSVLRGLQHTTHPSVFDRIRNVVFANTKKRSHPKFIRWAMANSNKPHRAGGYVIAAVLFLAAIAGLVTCFVYSAARPYRLLTALPFAMAVFTAASLMARICPVYYLWFHTRELPPWQMYQHSARTSSESMNSAQTDNNFSPSVKSEREDVHEYDMEKVGWSLDLARAARMDPLGPKNKWNNEPWVQSYERKSIWRKVFDKSDTIKEEGMLIVLRKVLLQSLAWSVALTVVWTVIVISVP